MCFFNYLSSTFFVGRCGLLVVVSYCKVVVSLERSIAKYFLRQTVAVANWPLKNCQSYGLIPSDAP